MSDNHNAPGTSGDLPRNRLSHLLDLLGTDESAVEGELTLLPPEATQPPRSVEELLALGLPAPRPATDGSSGWEVPGILEPDLFATQELSLDFPEDFYRAPENQVAGLDAEDLALADWLALCLGDLYVDPEDHPVTKYRTLIYLARQQGLSIRLDRGG